jgi:hypothetical protein
MRITKRQLKRIISEACDLSVRSPKDTLDFEHADETAPNDVPVPEDYDAVRDLLEQNSELVDLALSFVMSRAGTHCEKSSAQAIIDHLQDKIDNKNKEHMKSNFTFTGDVGSLSGDEAFGIGFEAGKRGLK